MEENGRQEEQRSTRDASEASDYDQC